MGLENDLISLKSSLAELRILLSDLAKENKELREILEQLYLYYSTKHKNGKSN